MKRTISFLLALVLILGMVPFSAMALEPAAKIETYTYINPLYADVITEADLNSAKEPAAAPQASGDPVYAATFAEAGVQMRQPMINREETIVVYYQTTNYDSAQHKDIFKAAVAHTGNPDEGDALQRVYGGYNVAISRSVRNGVSYVTYTYTMTYYTTAEQEAELKAARDELLATVDPNGTDYERFCTVYDYICANITYDYDTLNDDSYKLKFTAYAALVNKTAVCQGYAVLLYQLLLELGIDCRVITGIGNNGRHGWNIVKFGDVYYNTDPTWDASWYQGVGYYNYYLQNEQVFTSGGTNHIRDAEFDTTEFHALYPISETNFDPDAYEPETPAIPGGACGDNLTWELRNGVLTISGMGAMYDYDEAPWTAYREQISRIVVEKGVTTLGKNAFSACKNVTSVSLPDGLKSIGIAAFSACENLTVVDIPDSVNTIGKSAFCDCLRLTGIVIPEGVTEVSYEAFRNCQDLASVTIPSTVKVIRDTAFLHCHSLKSVAIPDGVTTIEYGAFMRCYGLQSVTIPNSVTSIGTYAFSECESLKSVTIPQNVTVIGQNTFGYCYDLAEVNLPDGLVEIQKYAFYHCEALQQIDLPKSLTTIGDYALAYASLRPDVTIPSAVEQIGNYAFAGDTLQTVYFLGDAPAIGNYAFGYQTITAYCPAGNATWTADVMQNYGGEITWVKECPGHRYDAVLTAPTCTEEGFTTYTCALCGDRYTDNYVDALGHSTVTDPGKAATCTEPGLTEGSYCGVCGVILTAQTEIPAAGHSWNDGVVTKEPTEEEPGVRTYTCMVCSDTREEVIPELNHTHNYSTKVVTAPTCTEGGYTTYTCRCGDWYTADEVPATGHSAVVDPAKAPTCTETGLTEGSHCGVCGVTLIAQSEVPVKAHNYKSEVTAPTCTEGGFTTYTCADCGDSYVADEVPATGHSAVTDPAKAPTCTEPGLTEGSHCGVCGVTLIAQSEVPVKAHNYKSEVTAPTCTEGGYTTYTCADCGNSYVADHTDALGHDHVNGTCIRCGAEGIAVPVIAVSTQASTGKPVINWNSVEGAAAYEIYAAVKGGAYTRLATVTATSYTHSAAAASKTYVYYVRAVAADGTKADSATAEVVCDLARPVLTLSNNTTTGKIIVSWNAVEGATGYTLYIYDANGKQIKATNTTKIKLTHSTAVAGASYTYKVKATCAVAAAASDVSASKTRVCDLARPVLTVANAASTGKNVVSWEAVEGATGYTLYIYDASGKLIKTTNTTKIKLTHSTAVAGASYTYKVKATCGVDAAASAVSAEKTRVCDLARPVLTVSNAASTGKNVVSWEAVEGATKYTLYIYDADGNQLKATTTTKTRVTHSTAYPGVSYTYKVRALCGVSAATSAYSAAKTRMCDLPRPTAEITLTSQGKPKVTWEAVNGAVSYRVYRATSSGGTQSLKATISADDYLVYVDTAAKNGATYYYTVIAVCADASGNSAKSSMVSITATAGVKANYYAMASCALDLCYEVARYPSSVKLERAYYSASNELGYPVVVLECSAKNGLGETGTIYLTGVRLSEQEYHNDFWGSCHMLYLCDDEYFVACSVYEYPPYGTYDGFGKLTVSSILDDYDNRNFG